MSDIRKPPADDWRRQGQERFLSGARLIARPYHPYPPGWDHDHCQFCGAKFSLQDGDLNEGYSTVDGYHWVCRPCVSDFRTEFRWLVDS